MEYFQLFLPPFVDVAENYEKVNIGGCYREVSENIIMGKAFDNRIGTFIAIELIFAFVLKRNWK